MSGFSLLLLSHYFEPEHPIECASCGGLFDLRFWAVDGEHMQCPECKQWAVVEEVIADQAEE